LLAAVSFPIIGVDFLHQFRLLVDPAANTLVDTGTAETFATVSSVSPAAATPPPEVPPPSLEPQTLSSPTPSVLVASTPSVAPPVLVTGSSTPSGAATAASAPPLDSGGFEHLLDRFPAVVNPSQALPRRPSGDVEHHIQTSRWFPPFGWREAGSGEGGVCQDGP